MKAHNSTYIICHYPFYKGYGKKKKKKKLESNDYNRFYTRYEVYIVHLGQMYTE